MPDRRFKNSICIAETTVGFAKSKNLIEPGLEPLTRSRQPPHTEQDAL